MDKSEMLDIIRMLKGLYPKDNFSPEEWYSMYQKFPSEIIRKGVQGWYSKDFGFRAPLPKDVRDMLVEGRSVGSYDPDGVFQKALDAIEANREIRT